MCGRATVIKNDEITFERFGFTEKTNSYDIFQPRYNLGPRQDIPAVHVDPDSGRTMLRPMHWNLVPSRLWSGEEVARFDREYSTFNARIERAADAPTFRIPWRRQRALVVVDGIIEWVGEKGKKTPYRLRLPDGAPFAMAGLWDYWRARDDDPTAGDQRELWSCSVVVGSPDPWFARFHHRMARILPPELYQRWLDPDLTDPRHVAALLERNPFPMETLVAERISTVVNNPRYDAPECMTPVAE